MKVNLTIVYTAGSKNISLGHQTRFHSPKEQGKMKWLERRRDENEEQLWKIEGQKCATFSRYVNSLRYNLNFIVDLLGISMKKRKSVLPFPDSV